MIRPAGIQDYKHAVPLINSAIGRIRNTLAGTDDHEKTIQVLESFFQKQGNRISFENAIVKELDGKVVGILLSYHGSQTYSLDRPFLERLQKLTGDPSVTIEKEACDDEYYLDTIAVEEEFQGLGIGTELLQEFKRLARNKGCNKLALLVERNNGRAFRLYRKLGYKIDGIRIVSGYEMFHMVAYLDE